MKAKKCSQEGKPTRSELMARIRSKNTSPEIKVRQLLFSMGYRFRLHRKELPGCPDIAFFSRRKAIFVNGCFWHQHPGCKKASMPATNRGYWLPKLERNCQRDLESAKQMELCNWEILVIWECEIKHLDLLRERLKCILGPQTGVSGIIGTNGREPALNKGLANGTL